MPLAGEDALHQGVRVSHDGKIYEREVLAQHHNLVPEKRAQHNTQNTKQSRRPWIDAAVGASV